MSDVALVRRSPAFGTLAWAAFLGSSWTWCIGMFLPVLLVRDYGLAGWIVFAIPNVLGAAAMGYVMSQVRDQAAFVHKHRFAMSAFSIVTIAFHLFFMSWMIAKLLPAGGVMALVTVAPIYFIGLFAARREGLAADVPAGVAVMIISLLAWLIYLRYGYAPPLAKEGLRSTRELAGLAPVCVFGFALCPYLDRTFHRAYRATGPSTAANVFAVGFAGFFLLMILFTLCYARQLGAVFDDPAPSMLGVVLWAIGFHMTFQSAFTVTAHLREARWTIVWLLVAAILALIVYGLGEGAAAVIDRSAGESSYRLFMGFYGLVFPAYAWICMTDRRRRVHARNWIVWAVSMVVASPFFWMGFMQQRTLWLLPGLLILLLARFVA